MRKSYMVLIAMAFLLTAFISIPANRSGEMLQFQFTLEQTNTIIYGIQHSDLPANVATSIVENIQKQAIPQLAPADTLNNER